MRRTKLISAILLIILILAAAGCAGVQETVKDEGPAPTAVAASASPAASAAPADEPTAESGGKDASDSRTLVVYFSRTGEQYGVGVIEEGNTAIVAKMIAEQTGADTFEILPVDDHYPMTYDALCDVAKREQSERARPKYKRETPDLSNYERIFIGAPVWWGDWPMICYTFFENEDLSGKTLYPFSTHAGSGLAGFDRKLASALPDSTVGSGLAVAGTDCQNNKDSVKSSVSQWLESFL